MTPERPDHQTLRGINVVALWAEGLERGYSSGVWASYRQWSAVGAQVRRGSQGTAIVVYKPTKPHLDAPDHDTSAKRRPRLVICTSTVFNQDQVEGWSPPDPLAPPVNPIKTAEAALRTTGASVIHGGSIAAYDRAEDQILMPDRDSFMGSPTSTTTESYYATMLHELIHWTGHGSRLDRPFGRFGDEAYAFEELFAELGAAFLCADLGVTNTPRPDHAAYVASWLKALRDDARTLFRAAVLADQAVFFVAEASMS